MCEVLKNFFVGLGLLFFRIRPVRLRVTQESREASGTLWIDVTRTSQGKRLTGIERVTREISRSLVDCLGEKGHLAVRFFRVDYLGRAMSVSDDWLTRPDISGLTRECKPCQFAERDVVFLLDHSLPLSGLNKREVGLLKMRGVFVIGMLYDTLPLTHRDLFPWRKFFIYREWLRGVSSSHALVFISNTARESFLTTTPWTIASPQKQAVIGLGPLKPKGSPKAPRPSGNWRQASARLLAVGTLEPRKDYSGIIDALERLWNEGHDFRLTIVGRYGWKSRALVRRIVNHSRFQKNLFWLRDVSDEHLERLMTSHDFLIANSVSEGFGLPLVEADALGLRVIARDIPVFREVLPGAIFFPGSSPQSLAEAISQSTERLDESWHERQGVDSRDWKRSAEAIVALIPDGTEG